MRWLEMTKEVIHFSSLITTEDLRFRLRKLYKETKKSASDNYFQVSMNYFTDLPAPASRVQH